MLKRNIEFFSVIYGWIVVWTYVILFISCLFKLWFRDKFQIYRKVARILNILYPNLWINIFPTCFIICTLLIFFFSWSKLWISWSFTSDFNVHFLRIGIFSYHSIVIIFSKFNINVITCSSFSSNIDWPRNVLNSILFLCMCFFIAFFFLYRIKSNIRYCI